MNYVVVSQVICCMQVHEACMLVSSVLVEGVKAQEVDFEVVDFMEQVVIPDITVDGMTRSH